MEPDERRAKALELHLAGATYDAIAKAVGYASRSGAYKAVKEALADDEETTPDLAEAASTELARLDAMLTGLWTKARRGDVQAVDRVMRIEERRTAILTHAAATDDDAEENRKETGLSDFEKRLREREQRAKAAHSAKSS